MAQQALVKPVLSIEIAKHFKCDIISADSRQFFKEMSIGTAKPTTTELAEAPHHFIITNQLTKNIQLELLKLKR